ncbi:MAG TPA: FHA domain-containing protein [Myxococcales bacterium]|jgi:pSer/pThr/pTyr-binding forkhead associated (FHA) protein
MKLIIEDDEGRKTVVPIVREDVEITIGRQEGNTIRLTERNVSRKHAKLARRSGMVSIEDLGSFNGIKVNGDRIQGTYQLKEGDLVQIGDYDLAIQSEEQKAPVSPAAAANAPTQQEIVAADGEGATLQSEVPEGEEHTLPSAKKHDSTAVISGSQLRASKTRKVVDIPAEEAPRLLLTTTDLAGREYACIRSELKIGRTDDNDIAIDHRSISRNHCKVVREENGEWKVLDLQSANGVKVNGEQYAESNLKPGDVLELGHLRFKFLAPGEEAPALSDTPAGGVETAKKSMMLPIAVGIGFLVAAGGSLGGWYVMTHRNPHPDPKEATPLPTPDNQAKPDDPTKTATGPEKPDKPDQPKVDPPDKPELPQLDPKVTKAFEEGKDLLSKGQWAKAEKKLARAKDFGVDEAGPLLEKARLELEAEKSLAEAEKRFKASDIAGAKAAAAAVPADSAVGAKAKALAAQIAAAEDKQAAVAKAADAKVTQEKKAGAEEQFNQGMTLFSERKYKEAAEFFVKAIQLDAGHAQAHMYLGTCYAKTNRFDEGAAEYEEFIHLAPTDKMVPRVIEILKPYYQKNPSRLPKYPLPTTP